MKRRDIAVRHLPSAYVPLCEPRHRHRHRHVRAAERLPEAVHGTIGDTSVGHSLQVEYVRISLEPHGGSVLFMRVWDVIRRFTQE